MERFGGNSDNSDGVDVLGGLFVGLEVCKLETVDIDGDVDRDKISVSKGEDVKRPAASRRARLVRCFDPMALDGQRYES